MRLESAYFSSSTGLEANAEALAVIGDNVSNANTVGFKAGNVQFSDLFSEGPEEHRSTSTEGAGSGVEVSEVFQDHSGGVIESTGRSLDVAIDGQGFIAVGTATDPRYTRAGSLIIDENGLLATTTGQNVLGYAPGDTTTLGTIDMTGLDLSGTPTTSISIAGNVSSTREVSTPPENPVTFNEIGQAASYTSLVTAYDSLGQGHEVALFFFKNDANSWTVQGYLDGAEVGQEAGTPVQVGANATLTFAANGVIDPANAAAATITGTPTYSNGAAPGNFTIDLSGFTQYAGGPLTSAITNDGQGTGDISDYFIDTDGSVYAVLSNGTQSLLGTMPVASFNNVEGLTRVGNALFEETQRSGEVQLGTAGTQGFGEVRNAVLELSNVDVSEEFVEMVIIQRAYSASSKVLTTTTDMLRETINLL